MSPATTKIEGPVLTVDSDADYDARLKREVRATWYHVHKATRPGAFVRPDRDGVPDSDDAMFTNAVDFKKAVAELRALLVKLRQHSGYMPKAAEISHLLLYFHEFLHCLVPWEGTVPAADYKHLKEIYDHPNDPIPALMHVVRTGFSANAFSRIFRWNVRPLGPFGQFLAWFESEVQRLGA